MSDAIAMLAAFQRELTEVVRAPLRRDTGRLVAAVETYPAALRARVRVAGCAPAERLAVYNRQYWFRLFGVLQSELRLTCALLGPWTFNTHAEAFLREHPPRGHDLAAIGEGFAAWLARRGAASEEGGVTDEVLREAAAIDDAFRVVTAAPEEAPLVLGEADVPHLATSRLRWARTCAVLDETYALVALRAELPAVAAERRVAVPARHEDGPRTYLVCRKATTLGHRRLAPAHARLMRLLAARTIGDAIGELAREHGAAIAGDAQRWLREGIELGLWVALDRGGDP